MKPGPRLAISASGAPARPEPSQRPKICAQIILLALAPVVLSQAGADGARILTSRGLGPVRLGMTVREAEAKLGARLGKTVTIRRRFRQHDRRR